mgnify:FL=1
MVGQNATDRARLKGYMWESVILQLLEVNGFTEIVAVDGVRTRRDRNNFFEIQGRGTYHQIDCPCDYNHFIAFMNPIRLLGEVKFYSRPVKKDAVREFIGVLKDVHENYFVAQQRNAPTERHTEVGAFFSANGFQAEAEKLAFAHNIKTVSHKTVALLEPLKQYMVTLEQGFLSTTECGSRGNQSDFVRLFRDCLRGKVGALEEFRERFHPADGFERVIEHLKERFERIRSNFVATTSGGALLHFVGSRTFPDELFARTDSQKCRVYYYKENGLRYFYLTLTEDREERRFYFTPPVSLAKAAFYGKREARSEKRRILKSMHITRRIDGLSRNLTLELDIDWLDAIEGTNE